MQGTVRTRRAGNRGCPRPLRGAAAPPAALARVAVVLWVTTLAVWWRVLTGGSLNPLDGPRLSPDAMVWLPALLIIVVIAVAMLLPMVGQGRSPHLTWRPRADRRRPRRRAGPRPAARGGHQDPQPVPRLRHLQGPARRQPPAGQPVRGQGGPPGGRGDRLHRGDRRHRRPPAAWTAAATAPSPTAPAGSSTSCWPSWASPAPAWPRSRFWPWRRA